MLPQSSQGGEDKEINLLPRRGHRNSGEPPPGPVDCQRLTTTLLTSITTITTAGGRSWAALGAKTYAIVTDTMLLAAFFSL